MFRKMRRFKQQLEQKECIEVLKSQPRGVLSILGEDGYPYGISIDYWYCEEENRIYPLTARRLRPLRWEMNCVCYLLDRAS